LTQVLMKGVVEQLVLVPQKMISYWGRFYESVLAGIYR
jgi:hypothetical protein